MAYSVKPHADELKLLFGEDESWATLINCIFLQWLSPEVVTCNKYSMMKEEEAWKFHSYS